MANRPLHSTSALSEQPLLTSHLLQPGRLTAPFSRLLLAAVLAATAVQVQAAPADSAQPPASVAVAQADAKTAVKAAAPVAGAAKTVAGQAQLSTTAVPKFSIAQLVQTVVDNNPDMRAVQQSTVTARAAVVTAGALPNPKLEWEQGRNSARMASATVGSVLTMGVSVPIEMPAVRSARLQSAQAGERASVQQIAMSRNTLVAQVELKAYEVVLRNAQAEAAGDAVRLLEQAHKRVRVRVDSGEAPRYELIKADAELINARQQEQTAGLQAEQSLLTLNRLAAGHLPARFALDLSLEDPVNVQVLQNANLQLHPELQQLQSEIERAQAQLAGARASRWPGVDLRMAHTREPDITHNRVGVTVQIPLFDQRRGPIDEASSELEKSRLRLEGRQAELQQQMQLAWKSLEMARTRTQALSQGSVRDAEAALRVAEAAYRYGERGILDVLDAQRVLRSVRADLLEARYQMQAARIELDFLAGRFAEPGAV